MLCLDVAMADWVIDEQEEEDGDIGCIEGYAFYQKINLNHTINEITNIQLYIFNDGTSGSGLLVTGIVPMPIDDPINVTAVDGITWDQFWISGVTADGWYDLDVTDVEINSSGEYCIYFETMFGSGEDARVDVGVNYEGGAGIPADYEFKKGSKAGGGWSSPDPDYNLTYRIEGYSTQMIPTSVYGIGGETASVWYDIADAEESTTIGYWIGNTPGIDEATKDNNNTLDTVNPNGFTSIAYGVPPAHLDPAEYYYLVGWTENSYGFKNYSDWEITFLTKPPSPSNFEITNITGTNATLTWDNATVYVTNWSTVIVRSNINYPIWTGTQWSNDGVEIYNGTSNTTLSTGLNPATTYYYTAYTYINASGSPWYWWYSDVYGFTSNTTDGGGYNVTVRWECDDTLVDLSADDYVFKAYRSTGEVVNLSYPTAVNGRFNFSAPYHPDVWELTTNATDDLHINSTTRKILLDPGGTNATIYIPCGEIGSNTGDIAEVTIYFMDFTGTFNQEHDAIAFLFRYNGTTREYIHMDYSQADEAMRCNLIIGNSYHIGAGSSEIYHSDLGELYINQLEYLVEISLTVNRTYWWELISTSSSGWSADTLFLDIYEYTLGTANASVSLYYLSNDTLIDQEYMAVPFDFNYTHGPLNTTFNYYIVLDVIYSGTSESWNATVVYIILGTPDVIISDPGVINIIFNALFGGSPVYTAAGAIAWTSLIAAVVITFVLFTFSEQYAGIGVIVVGLMLGFLKNPLGLITDDVINWSVVSVIIVLGILTLLYMRKRE